MIRSVTLILVFLTLPTTVFSAQESAFDNFLTNFDYETRADMKIDSKKLIILLTEKKAVLVDIRFPEETKAWKMGFGLYIPLNELPKRLAVIFHEHSATRFSRPFHQARRSELWIPYIT